MSRPIALLVVLAFTWLHTAALACGPERCGDRCPDLLGNAPCEAEACDHHEDAPPPAPPDQQVPGAGEGRVATEAEREPLPPREILHIPIAA